MQSFVLGLVAVIAGASGGHAQVLTRITGVDPVTAVQSSRAINWVDVDGDGDLDLYVTNGGSLRERNEFYWNNGGVFSRDTTIAITRDSLRDDGSTWGDYDNDGLPDLFLASWYNEVNALFHNLGGGVFQRITTGAVATTHTFSEGAAWADYDADGDLDLYVSNSGSAGGAGRDNILYRNDGGGAFTQVTTGPLVHDGDVSRGPTWADYDNDGDVDLFTATETGFPNHLYRNELRETGTATFVDQAAGDLTTDAGNSWSGSWGDFDNDGDLDIIVSTSGGENDQFYRNQLAESGVATFTRIIDQDPATDAAYSTGTAWADWDHDGDQDLLVTCGWGATSGQKQANRYYRNQLMETGTATLTRSFESSAASDSGWSYGAAWGDDDNDGDLDLAIANWQGTAQANYLYRNEAQLLGRHWIEFRLQGTTSNRSGIGARMTVKATIAGQPVIQIRELTGADGYCGQTLRAHLGLGDAAHCDTVIVNWPSGIVQRLIAVPADTVLTITEPSSAGVPGGERSGPQAPGRILVVAGPNPVRGSMVLRCELPRPATVRVAIVDALGRVVRQLGPSNLAAGAGDMAWDGRDARGAPVPSGVYYAAMTTTDGGRDRATIIVAR